jgi:hypothetical protein
MESKYLGMTVNERLYVSGLIDTFESAILDKDIETIIISILRKVELDDESIGPILEQHGLKNI